MGRIEENCAGLVLNFSQLGLSVECVGACENDAGELYLFNLVKPSKYNRDLIESCIEKLAIHYGFNASLVDSEKAQFGVQIRYPKRFLPLLECMDQAGEFDIVIGKDTSNNIFSIDFSEIKHLLIVGSVASGKSTLITDIVLNTIIHNKNCFPQIVIFDAKNGDLRKFNSLKWAALRFTSSVNEMIETLKEMEKLMDYRRSGRISNNYDVFLFIDCYEDLVSEGKNDIDNTLRRLIQQGHNSRIHLIVATKNSSCPLISNLPNRICLQTKNEKDSYKILFDYGAEELNIGEGFYIKTSSQKTKFKIAYPNEGLLDFVIKHLANNS